jgi:hypothetical protein
VRIFFTLLLFAALTTGIALAADVDGVWKASMPGRDGQTFDMTIKLKAEGDKLTGTMSGARGGDTEIQDGKVSGDSVSFKIKREFGGNSFVMTYEGKLTGDEIKFKTTREGSDRPPREFTAKRVS